MWRLSGERKRTGTNKEGDISRCYRPHKAEGFVCVRAGRRAFIFYIRSVSSRHVPTSIIPGPPARHRAKEERRRQDPH